MVIKYGKDGKAPVIESVKREVCLELHAGSFYNNEIHSIYQGTSIFIRKFCLKKLALYLYIVVYVESL